MSSFGLALVLMGGLILQVFIPGFPKETLLLQSGAEFGIVGGTLINWVGMVLAAQVGYEVVRRSIQVGGRFSEVLDEYQDSDFVTLLQDRGNYGLFLVRLLPYAPNDVLSLLAGGLMLPRLGFVLVSLVTALPYAVIFAYLGQVGSQFLGRQTVWQINLVLMILVIGIYGINHLVRKSRDISS